MSHDRAACPVCEFTYSTVMDEPSLPRHWLSADGKLVRVGAPPLPYRDHPAWATLVEGFRKSTHSPEHLAFLALRALDGEFDVIPRDPPEDAER